jgi:hypothetical protein
MGFNFAQCYLCEINSILKSKGEKPNSNPLVTISNKFDWCLCYTKKGKNRAVRAEPTLPVMANASAARGTSHHSTTKPPAQIAGGLRFEKIFVWRVIRTEKTG